MARLLSLLPIACLSWQAGAGSADEALLVQGGYVMTLDPALGGFGGGDPAALLVYSARPENARTVLVDGRIVKQDGQLLGVDMADLPERARRSARELPQRTPFSR